MYKTVKDIEKSAGIYHYVAESSCFAKSHRNRLTNFAWASFRFFLTNTKQTNKQTNYFISPHWSQIWNELNELMLMTRGFWRKCAFWGLDDEQNRNFGGVNRHFKPIRQKFKSHILKTMHRIGRDKKGGGKGEPPLSPLNPKMKLRPWATVTADFVLLWHFRRQYFTQNFI